MLLFIVQTDAQYILFGFRSFIPDLNDVIGRQLHAPSEADTQKFVCIYNIHNLIFVQRKNKKLQENQHTVISHMLIKLLTTGTSDVHPLQQLR